MAVGRPNSQRHIRERREKILLLMSRGYNQKDIVNQLHITRQTISRDMHK
jgi:DNA-binding NarL/FixJ family response regulator